MVTSRTKDTQNGVPNSGSCVLFTNVFAEFFIILQINFPLDGERLDEY